MFCAQNESMRSNSRSGGGVPCRCIDLAWQRHWQSSGALQHGWRCGGTVCGGGDKGVSCPVAHSFSYALHTKVDCGKAAVLKRYRLTTPCMRAPHAHNSFKTHVSCQAHAVWTEWSCRQDKESFSIGRWCHFVPSTCARPRCKRVAFQTSGTICHSGA